jgi:NADPH:quinone reductase-like Zn-dependent oxidoreductase
MMKALQVEKFTEPTAIQVKDVADLQPTADQVIV